mmetsp:Transcript_16356/g.49334  ORF Transcript_16356/g.49334 Transcript_16356/m.49334 type:complete len:131 (-) Transcript_16356:1391-1783(-)
MSSISSVDPGRVQPRPLKVVSHFRVGLISESSRADLNFSVGQAAASALDPSHNEFFNLATDIVPLVYFSAAALRLATAADGGGSDSGLDGNGLDDRGGGGEAPSLSEAVRMCIFATASSQQVVGDGDERD